MTKGFALITGETLLLTKQVIFVAPHSYCILKHLAEMKRIFKFLYNLHF